MTENAPSIFFISSARKLAKMVSDFFNLKKFREEGSEIPTIQRVLLAFITSLTMSASALFAMEIEQVQESQIGCTIRISGYISEDAGEEFLEWFVNWRRQRNPEYDFYQGSIGFTGTGERVCFDSVGGSYIGGLALANMLRGASTGVDVGDTCESACFIAFMMGSFDRMEDRQIIPDRVMHPSARVGFHQPGISLTRDSYTFEDVALSWEIAMQVVAGMLELRISEQDATGVNPILYGLNEERMRDMFLVPFREMERIETVGDALRYGITVHPVIMPTIGSDDLDYFRNVCRALGEISEDFNLLTAGPNDPVVELNSITGELIVQLDFDVGESGTSCTLGYVSPENVNRYLELNSGFMTRAWIIGSMHAEDWWIPPNDFAIAPFMHYGGDLPLTELPTGDEVEVMYQNGRTLSQIRSTFSQNEAYSFGFECGRGNTASVINVNEYVNIRTQPSLRSQIVARAQLGERLTLLTPDQWWVLDTPRGRQCSQLCQQSASSPALQPALRQCIEDAEIWHQVRNARGQTGYVSVYFLGEGG